MKIKLIFIVFLIVQFSFGQDIQVDSLVKITNSKISEINSEQNQVEVFNYKLTNFTLDNSSMRATIVNGSVVKIEVLGFKENLKQVNTYYFDKDLLIYASQIGLRDNKVENLEPLLDIKSYFDNNFLTTQIDFSDTSIVNSQEYLMAAGDSILDEVEILKLLLSSSSFRK